VHPDEYTEYHENVLQSYRHKQLKTQMQGYTEVPEEAIWWHRMQENPSAAGAPPRTPLRGGGLQRSPRPSSWWGWRLAAPSPRTPCSRPFGPRISCPPLQNCAPQCPTLDEGWRRPWISHQLRLKLVFMYIGRRLLFLHSIAGFGFSYSGLYLKSS